MTGPSSVSVVIPLYNKAREIERTLRSVLAQTVQPAEIIVIDDGSTDSGSNVVRSMGNSLIRLETQSNAGVSAARNRGIALAKSDLVAFLDADDEWKSDFLKTVLDLRERFPSAGLWATAFEIVDAPCSAARLHPGSDLPETTGGGILNDFFLSSLQGPPFCCSSVLCSKSILVEAGGFPGDVRMGEDFDTWIRIALKYPVAFSPVPGAVYHKESSNRAMNREQWTLADSCLRRTLGRAIVDRGEAGIDTRSLRKLLGWHLLEIARHAAAAGDRSTARKALREVVGHRVWLWRAGRYWVRSWYRRGSI